MHRAADAVHGAHELAVVLLDRGEHVRRDARHDDHVDHDVGRVGELDAVLGQRRSERSHRERDHVHRATSHAAGHARVQLLGKIGQAQPFRQMALHALSHVRNRVIALLRADKSLAFNACDVIGVRDARIARNYRI